MKFVFFGDSLTEGTYGSSYVDKVAAAMRGHHFLNRGVNGDTSLNLYRRVQQDVIAEQPDGVFIMIGVNDAVSSVDPGMRNYFRFFKRVPGGQVSAISFRENMRAILGRLQVAGIKTWVALPPIEYSREQVAALRQMNNYAAEVCAEQRVPTLDLMAQLTPANVPSQVTPYQPNFGRSLLAKVGIKPNHSESANSHFTYTFDGVHLTDAGAQRIADLIVPFLRANGVG